MGYAERLTRGAGIYPAGAATGSGIAPHTVMSRAGRPKACRPATVCCTFYGLASPETGVAINRDKILQEAQKLVDKKRYDKAIAEYQKVVADDPHDVRTLLKIGDIYLRMQQFAEAIASYDRVANHYSVQGFSVKAVAVYKQMREIIQKHAPHLEDRFGHVVPKLADLLTQLDLRSDALAYYDEMATRLQTVGRERDAIDIFRKIVSLDGNNPVSHLRLADALARVRDFDGASVEFGDRKSVV